MTLRICSLCNHCHISMIYFRSHSDLFYSWHSNRKIRRSWYAIYHVLQSMFGYHHIGASLVYLVCYVTHMWQLNTKKKLICTIAGKVGSKCTQDGRKRFSTRGNLKNSKIYTAVNCVKQYFVILSKYGQMRLCWFKYSHISEILTTQMMTFIPFG